MERTREYYAPYDKMPEFQQGIEDYSINNYNCPYDPNSVAAQAWDRGLEYAMRNRPRCLF